MLFYNFGSVWLLLSNVQLLLFFSLFDFQFVQYLWFWVNLSFETFIFPKKSKSSCLTGSSCSCLSQTLARRTIFGKGHARNDFVTKIKRKKINKFKESAWKCVYFLSAELLALVVSRYEPWFTNTKYFWVGPGDQIWPDQKTKWALLCYLVSPK